MASWHKTCGLSNLHITSGTPVYVFVLEHDTEAGFDKCFTTGVCAPLLLPFTSEYNGYGGGVNSSGKILDIVLDSIRDHIVPVSGFMSDVNAASLNEQSFFEFVSTDSLKINRPYLQRPINVTFTMFRKDVVDHILETREVEYDLGINYKSYDFPERFTKIKFKDIVADVRPFIEQIASGFYLPITDPENSMLPTVEPDHFVRTDFSEGSPTEYRMMVDSVLSDVLYGYGQSRTNKLIRYLRTENTRFSLLVNMRELITTYIDENKLDQLEEILIEHVKATFIDDFMSSARKVWIPGGHEGNESYSSGALQLLGDAINKVIAKEEEGILIGKLRY